jgi:hypothetical protein
VAENKMEVRVMRIIQFAVPERAGKIVAEAAAIIAGGATLLPNAMGWWVDDRGEVQREAINWLIVGTPEDKIDELINEVKSILKSAGEAAIFYAIGGEEAKLEWL